MKRVWKNLRRIAPRMERVPWRVEVMSRSDQEPHRITYTVREGVQWAVHLGPPDEDDENSPEVT